MTARVTTFVSARRFPPLRWILGSLLAATGMVSGTVAAQPDAPGSVDLRATLRAELAMSNPGLVAARAAVGAEASRAEATGYLPDPQVTYGYFVEPVETRVGAQRHQLGVRQALPWWGSLGRQRAAADVATEIARTRVEAAWLDATTRLDEALHDLHRIDGALVIEHEALALLQQFEGVARARFRVDSGRTNDLLRLQLELARTEDRIRRLDERRAPVVATLNALLARSFEMSFPNTPALIHAEDAVSIDVLERRLTDAHPALAATRLEQVRQERLAATAIDRGRPTITLGLFHTFVESRDLPDLDGDGGDATLATISLSLPLWRGKTTAEVSGARSRQAQWRATEDDVEAQLRARLRAFWFDFEDASARVDLYQGTLVPKAEESLRATLGAYSQGRVDFDELIAVERELLEFRVSLLNARVARANAWSKIQGLAPDPGAMPAALVSTEVTR